MCTIWWNFELTKRHALRKTLIFQLKTQNLETNPHTFPSYFNLILHCRGSPKTLFMQQKIQNFINLSNKWVFSDKFILTVNIFFYLTFVLNEQKCLIFFKGKKCPHLSGQPGTYVHHRGMTHISSYSSVFIRRTLYPLVTPCKLVRWQKFTKTMSNIF